MVDMHGRKPALVFVRVPEGELLTAVRGAERVVNVEDLLLPRFTPTQNWSISAAARRAASTLRGAFSRREIVDCDANGPPLSGQRPTAIFNSGSCRNRLRSFPSLYPQLIANARAATSSNISCPTRD
jgi:hypothetical protein